MNINLTLLGQSITFVIFVWFCMRFAWPPIKAMMAERQEAIATGLRAAQDAEERLAKAASDVDEELRRAKAEAAKIIEAARTQSAQMIDEAKNAAKEEAEDPQPSSEPSVFTQAAFGRPPLPASCLKGSSGLARSRRATFIVA